MGIYDRDYYRREGPSFLASFTEHGKVCKWLIAINVVCFVIQLITRNRAIATPVDGVDLSDDLFKAGWFTEALWLDVSRVLHGEVWRLLTFAFLHDTGSLWHIVFNMLFLWWFGSDIEDLYGPREFLTVYLTSVVLGGVAFVVGNTLLGLRGTFCVGASGGVMTVLVLCALHYPTRIIYLFCLIPVPIWLFVAFEVAQDVFPLLSGMPTHTAVSVHLAGAAFAFVYYKMQWRLLNFLPSPGAWRRQRAKARLRIYREEDASDTPVRVASAPAVRDVDELLEARMDAVLQKVSNHGIESLTAQEREILLQASERLKRKRK
jgi:membrane associated rhomboid family serine protease